MWCSCYAAGNSYGKSCENSGYEELPTSTSSVCSRFRVEMYLRERTGASLAAGWLSSQPCRLSPIHLRKAQAVAQQHGRDHDPAPVPVPASPSPLPPRPGPSDWNSPSCSSSKTTVYSNGSVCPYPYPYPSWRRLLPFLALLLLLPLLVPVSASVTSVKSTQLRLELDLRQLQQTVASTGFVGDVNTNPNPSGSQDSTSSQTTATTTTTTTTTTSSSATTANAIRNQSSLSSSTTAEPNVDGPSYELPGNPSELTTCLNTHQPDIKGTSWVDAMRDQPTYFKVVGMWWSRKRADVPVTITTQLSWNRKWQLKAMCRSWAGPIAAVMHMPVLLPRLTRSRDAALGDVSNATLQRAVDTVAAFHARLDATQPCKLDLMLLAEPYRDGKSLVLYPVNTLRNYARLMSRTPLIGLVDVDLIVSSNLRTELLNTSIAARYLVQAREAAAAAAAGKAGPLFSTGSSRLHGVPGSVVAQLNLTAARTAQGPRAAWVLPAFETRGGSVSLQVERAEKLAAGGSKSRLHAFYKQGKVLRFDWGSTGHKNTDYSRWFSTAEPYVVEWYDRYEPWVFVDRLSSSWSDARFRGYGKNKISHIRTLAYDGYELRVHPSAFLIHRPHLESSSSNAHARGALYGKKTKTSSMYGHNVFLYKMIQLSMAYGNYTPVVDPATAACRDKLSWWQQ
ncbi:hypothetical protein Vafri_17410 [Volvox africanus]|uniref:Glycosyltransferase-like protein LARGE2 n=1 Tax=Volvox africanus TaxID=51714 RepID=A0A8J4F7M6_9CHLO|nr:hypothetical protein Vafri_17410 [Volvox africanus]